MTPDKIFFVVVFNSEDSWLSNKKDSWLSNKMFYDPNWLPDLRVDSLVDSWVSMLKLSTSRAKSSQDSRFDSFSGTLFDAHQDRKKMKQLIFMLIIFKQPSFCNSNPILLAMNSNFKKGNFCNIFSCKSLKFYWNPQLALSLCFALN